MTRAEYEFLTNTIVAIHAMMLDHASIELSDASFRLLRFQTLQLDALHKDAHVLNKYWEKPTGEPCCTIFPYHCPCCDAYVDTKGKYCQNCRIS